MDRSWEAIKLYNNSNRACPSKNYRKKVDAAFLLEPEILIKSVSSRTVVLSQVVVSKSGLLSFLLFHKLYDSVSKRFLKDRICWHVIKPGFFCDLSIYRVSLTIKKWYLSYMIRIDFVSLRDKKADGRDSTHQRNFFSSKKM